LYRKSGALYCNSLRLLKLTLILEKERERASMKAREDIKAKHIEIGIPKREKEEIDPILRGVINYFDDTKGYGFIKTADDENFFVHQNNISGEPAKGKKVQFEKEKGAKGWAAVRVVIE